jgi:hypothetical protein
MFQEEGSVSLGDVVPIGAPAERKGASLDLQKPLLMAAGLSQSKFGRTSAPRRPQAEQVNLGSIIQHRLRECRSSVMAFAALIWIKMRIDDERAVERVSKT